VPSEQLDHQRRDAEVEQVVGGRERSFDEQGQEAQLQRVGCDGYEHGELELRAGRDGDRIVCHENSVRSILDDEARSAPDLAGGDSIYVVHGIVAMV